MKNYMVIEHFKPGCFDQVYHRFSKKGRMLPNGLSYLNSWVSKENNVCYQLMETDNVALFSAWVKNWDDLVEFEIIPLD
ncbi:MAG: DUF3303 domain-containing protein [Gammaproteobacteria bacterium]|nr:DUF3303 domain-containing protein [Gammaproteobacteria bacterium]